MSLMPARPFHQLTLPTRLEGRMMTNIDPSPILDVVVVGAGQAGLATAYHLSRQGAQFLVVDAGGTTSVEAWRRPVGLFAPVHPR